MKNPLSKPPEKPSRPGAKRLLALVSTGIFVGEILVMMVVSRLDGGLSLEMQILLDAMFLMALTFPLLYYFFYRPLASHIAARERMEAELREVASRDPLTNVANRRFGLDWLEAQLKLSARNGSNLCVCFADLDSLKEINDLYGHGEGDEAIQMASLAMLRAVRESDLIARLGGDEFLIVMPDCTLEQAEAIWGRIEGELRSISARAAKPFVIRLSHGTVEQRRKLQLSVQDLLSAADQKMYADKNRSRSARSEGLPHGIA